jgi:GNAT superfamily N-acetyltransferase
MSPVLLTVDAVQRGSGGGGMADGMLPAVAGEVRVGQAMLLRDGRCQLAHGALLEVANDEEALERLLYALAEQAAEAAMAGVTLGAGLVPAFPEGILLDNYYVDPPLHGAYNAPFLPDLLAEQAEPLFHRRLWSLSLDAGKSDGARPGGAANLTIEPAPPDLLAGDLLPLLEEIWRSSAASAAGFAAPDVLEVSFLLALWQVAPLTLLVARRAERAVGFCLLQPDVGPQLRRLRGGQPLWTRAWLALQPLQRARSGRLLLGGVAPDTTGQGVGGALWRSALAHARASGWQSLTIGPVDEGAPVEAFLAAQGATPHHRSVVFLYGG